MPTLLQENKAKPEGDCSAFVLVAAMNPFPCGYYGDPIKPCSCAPSTVTKYQKRISGPLLDRIDVHVEVPRVDYQKLSDDRLGEPSEGIRAQVERLRELCHSCVSDFHRRLFSRIE